MITLHNDFAATLNNRDYLAEFYRRKRRAQRIAEAVGDARAVEVDGDWAIIVDYLEAGQEAERLVMSQALMFDIYDVEQVVSCDVCADHESRPMTDALPPGWRENHDAEGNLIGFLCPEHAGTQ